MVRRREELFRRLNVDINLEVPLFKLSMAEQLMVELARVLSIDPRIIIFDEISSKLTPVEMEVVYPILFEATARAAASSTSPTTWTRSSTSPTGSPC